MSEENTTPASPKSGSWKVLGIIAVVFGGLSILFAFIPCLGAYAMYTGGLATILSIIALVLANNAQAPKTLAIIALVVSLASAGIGYWQYTQIKKAGAEMEKSLEKFKHDVDSASKTQ